MDSPLGDRGFIFLMAHRKMAQQKIFAPQFRYIFNNVK